MERFKKRVYESYFRVAPFLQKIGWLTLLGAGYEIVTGNPDAPKLAFLSIALILFGTLPSQTHSNPAQK